MRSRPFQFSLAGLLLLGILALTGCGTSVRVNVLTTTVTPLPSEDLSAACLYDMVLADSTPKKAVLVIFERGDSIKLFEDADVAALATELHLAIVFAHQCNSSVTGDIQADATKGPARALFTALTQLSRLTPHPEIAQASVIPYGFSAAGVLAITLAQAHPDRVLGAIPYAAGSGYLDLEDVSITPSSTRVPMLIMANSLDSVVGTRRTLDFFGRGRSLGAPWAFAVQNGTGHCCNLSAKPLMTPWIRALISPQIAASQASLVSFHCTPNGVEDSYGLTDCSFTSASLGMPLPSQQSGVLPDGPSSNAWLAWVSGSATN